jgi:MoxR-like ATPase
VASSKVRGIETEEHVGAVRAAIGRAQLGLVDRESIAEAVVLCAVAGEHLLVVGPPGTGKSEAVRRVADELGGHYFEYLVGRFTEPNELFGPIDLRRLREGVVEVETAGMLPEAEVAFLDEVFLGSTAILNTLLGMLNERVFRRGRTVLPVAHEDTLTLDRTFAVAGVTRFPVHADVATVWSDDGRIVCIDLAAREVVANLRTR